MEIKVNKSQTATQLSDLKDTHDDTLAELERYKLLVESVEDYAIFLLDSTGHVQTWNKGAAKNKGYTADDIIGKHFSTFYLQEDIDAGKPERELVLAERLGRVEDEDWRVRKDGSQFWANVVITALKDSDGQLVGFAKVTRDLTERKHNEDLLRQTNIVLRKQQRDLEASNVSKDEFISLASHQLRTPATAIKQLLGLLIQGFAGDVNPEHLALISRAYDANERQIRIVNNLLKVAQIDAGKVVLRKESTNLVDYMMDIMSEHEETLKKKHQTISFTADPDVPTTLELDVDHLRMALSNIIDNASKYSYADSPVTITATKQGDEVVIDITDQGIGVDKADIPKLFNKFARIPNELSDKVGGSGLGLYWVKRVIALHGGRIEVTSEKNKGTTFHIYLPLDQAAEEAHA